MKNLPHCAHNKLFKKCKSPIGLPHYKHFFYLGYTRFNFHNVTRLCHVSCDITLGKRVRRDFICHSHSFMTVHYL